MTAASAGGGLAEVLAVLDADLRYTEQRLAKTRRKADESASRKGDRQPGADDHCDWVEHVLAHKRAARAAIAELIAAAKALNADIAEVQVIANKNNKIDRDKVIGFATAKHIPTLRAALSNIEGASHG